MSFVWTLAWKATWLLLFGFAGAYLLRRASAASRAALWQGVAVAIVLTAALSNALRVVGPKPAAIVAALHFDVAAVPVAPASAIPWASALWLAGVILVLGRLLTGHAVMLWVTRKAPERITAPVTWGVLRPSVHLPASADSWPAAKREVVLRHEEQHVRRHDSFWQFLWQVICGVLWFHPLAWMAFARLQQDAEEACDDAVLASGLPAPEYAELLLDFAAAAPASPVAFGMQSHTDLAARVRAILNPAHARGGVTMFASLLVAVALVAAAPLAAVPDKKAPEKTVYSAKDPDVTGPRPIKQQKPNYPADAKEQKIQGSVKLLVVVDEEGKAKVEKVEQAVYPSIDAAAVDAVENWVFEPAYKGGKPVTCKVTIEMNFKLQ